jgi:lysozyme family protein
MAQSSEAAALARVFAHEGGYTNHPKDPGGPTNWGITIIDARLYGKEFGWVANPTVADVQAMPKWFAEKVYDKKYWDAERCDDLPPGVDYVIADYGINSGIGRSGKVLRRLVGLPDNTSKVTDEVIAAVNKRDPKALVAAICDERLAFLHGLKTWPDFGNGWGRRVSEVREFGLQLASQMVVAPSQPEHVPGKGHVPPPTGTKTTIKVGAGGGAAWAANYLDWIAAHPVETGLVIVGGVVIVAGALHLANRWHQSKQEAPVPGFRPVPAIA